MNDTDKNNELDNEQLDNVTGGLSPRLPTTPVRIKGSRTSAMMKAVIDNMSEQKEVAEKPFDVCPVCHSESVSFNRVENICMCQNCGYCEDRSK